MRKNVEKRDLVLRFFQGSKSILVAVLASLVTTGLNFLHQEIFRFTVDSQLGGDKYKIFNQRPDWALMLVGVALFPERHF